MNDSLRRWSTAVLVLAGLVSVAFNLTHAFTGTRLPWPLAVLYGVAPVGLAAMLSHVLALQAVERIGWWRRGLIFTLTAGALALSYLAVLAVLTREVPDPIPGTPWNEPAILFPIVIDLAALAGLGEMLRRPPKAAVEAAEMDDTGSGDDGPTEDPDAIPEDLARDVERILSNAVFEDEFRSGELPSIRRIRSALKCGQERAKRAHTLLTELAS